MYFVGVWVRAWRWHYLLGPIKKIPTETMFPITTIGYMGNNVYPARAGEVLRAVILRRREGVPVLKQMLDREYVERTVTREVRQDADQDPVADVLISGLRAAATLKDESLKPSVTALSRNDRSMKVRDAALEALKLMG